VKKIAYFILASLFGVLYAIIMHIFLLNEWLGLMGVIILAIILSIFLGLLFICIPNKKIVAIIIACCLLGFPFLLITGGLKGIDILIDKWKEVDALQKEIKVLKIEGEIARLEAEKAMKKMDIKFMKIGCSDAMSGKDPYPYKSEGYLKGYNTCKKIEKK